MSTGDFIKPAETGRVLLKLLLRRASGEHYDLAAVAGRPRALRTPEPDLIGRLWTDRDVLLARLRAWSVAASGSTDDIPAQLAAHLVRWLHRCNQFLTVTPSLQGVFEERYREALGRATAALVAASSVRDLELALSAVFREHHDALAALITQAYGDRLRDTPCAQYTPELQLEILGAAGEALLEPVLDVGCGEDANLVEALKAAGYSAIGFDRHGPAAGRGDWLSYEYGAGRWGTVVSHLGFSLHFLHEHLRGAELTVEYARAYMRILRSLRPQGSFLYAPSLPFIERLLGENYQVERRAWRDPRAPLAELSSASRVWRLR